MMAEVGRSTHDLGRLADLTRRYARYSASATGLGGAVGGALVLVAYLAGALLPEPSLAWRLALGAAPVVWLVVKELLRARYYQHLGHAQEVRTAGERRLRLALTLLTAAVAVGVAATVLARRPVLDAGTLGYLAYVVAMPLLVWRFMRTPLEFVAGAFLVVQAAVVSGGGRYQLWEQPQAPLAGLALLGLGLRQHMEFLRLRRELAVLSGATDAPAATDDAGA